MIYYVSIRFYGERNRRILYVYQNSSNYNIAAPDTATNNVGGLRPKSAGKSAKGRAFTNRNLQATNSHTHADANSFAHPEANANARPETCTSPEANTKTDSGFLPTRCASGPFNQR